jgi:hypothetical protein
MYHYGSSKKPKRRARAVVLMRLNVKSLCGIREGFLHSILLLVVVVRMLGGFLNHVLIIHHHRRLVKQL